MRSANFTLDCVLLMPRIGSDPSACAVRASRPGKLSPAWQAKSRIPSRRRSS